MTIDKSAVGGRIAGLRRELGWSQSTLAERLGVSTQAVSKWETGQTLPEPELLLNLSWLGNRTINAILEGDQLLSCQDGLERGLSVLSRFLTCPVCTAEERAALRMEYPIREEGACFVCNRGHCFQVEDGVLYFGSREIWGEQWSLYFRNYNHYLQEQRHSGNPRYWQGDPHFREVMWRRIELLRPKIILDMACGTGSGIKYVIQRIHWPTVVVMADLSHRVLKYNRQFFADEWRNPYVEMVYLACDCARLPLADGSVDLVFSNAGFESMQNKMMNGFQEGFRVLRPGGHAVYNISCVEEPAGENSRKWMELYRQAADGSPAGAYDL